ncbi:MAG: hypothetical protein DI535_19285 [Citrobacter freundii]|nr:MAG: hypothetical protein DI535_19285 [Citrobacter freundii]
MADGRMKTLTKDGRQLPGAFDSIICHRTSNIHPLEYSLNFCTKNIAFIFFANSFFLFLQPQKRWL